MNETKERLVVVDFGSQYAHLIAKRLRHLGYYTEIASPTAPVASLMDAKGIILSGGPKSLDDPDAPEFNEAILDIPVPILGLCYGHYLMQAHYGGEIRPAGEVDGEAAEYGRAMFIAQDEYVGEDETFLMTTLYCGILLPKWQVWMSHEDTVVKPGEGFVRGGRTQNCKFAGLYNREKERFSLQFHPEVADTDHGELILENFARYCWMPRNWDETEVLERILAQIKADAGEKNVLLFLSGGVDSSVTFALLNKALGKERVLGLHIDNGFMRRNESSIVEARYRHYGMGNFRTMSAGDLFLAEIDGKVDPQAKRKAVGEAFITARNRFVQRLKLNEDEWLLAQGTLYPDIIESGGTQNSNVIKTHHNRVKGVQDLIEKGLIIEPLRDLYKDEVRAIGKKLGLPDELVYRHPFPGPGLSINVLCLDEAMYRSNLSGLIEAERELAAVQAEAIAKSGGKICTIYPMPIRSTGVQGDQRTYAYPAVLTFPSGGADCWQMPANWSEADWEMLDEVSTLITNRCRSINRCILLLYTGSQEDRLWQATLGSCTKERLDTTREVDAIMLGELKEEGWYRKVFQHLTINLPIAAREGACSIVLRTVCSEDVMTATFARLPKKLLDRVVHLAVAGTTDVDAIYYDVTNKPPATFGWE